MPQPHETAPPWAKQPIVSANLPRHAGSGLFNFGKHLHGGLSGVAGANVVTPASGLALNPPPSVIAKRGIGGSPIQGAFLKGGLSGQGAGIQSTGNVTTPATGKPRLSG